MERRKAADYLPNDPDAVFAFRVRSVEMFALSDALFINADALVSLQILRSEFHPNTQMQGPDKAGSGSKENLSVFGLFQFMASTPQGKAKLRQMFLRPSKDIRTIEERHRTVATFLRPDNSQVLESVVKILKKLVNVRKSLILLHKGVELPSGRISVKRGVWATLHRFSAYSIQLREAASKIHGGDRIPVIGKVGICTHAQLTWLTPRLLSYLAALRLKRSVMWES